MNIIVETLNKKKINVNLERAELILGATAFLTKENLSKDDKVINPITNEMLPIIKSNENRFFVPAHNIFDYNYAKQNNLEIKQVVAPYFYGTGEEKPRKDVKTQTRHSVIAVIKDLENNKYICLDCKNRNCKSFVMGGIEQGETIEEAALREVKEETGYLNVKIDRISDISMYNHFYAGYKGVNRYAILEVVFGHLENNQKEELSAEENSKHVVKYIDEEDLKDYINVNNNMFVIEELLHQNKPYEKEEGKIINSTEYNKMDIFEARKKIEQKLLS